MKGIKSLLLLILLCTPIFAQKYRVIGFPRDGQMPTAFVHRFLQDSDGYMWYATMTSGLCRDNGYQIDVFRYIPGQSDLFDQEISSIAEDRQNGRIWFSTAFGFAYLDKKDYSIHRALSLELNTSAVVQVFVDSKNRIWASREDKVYQLDADGKIQKTYKSVYKGKSHNISNFYEDSRHHIWLTQWRGGLLCYDEKSDRLVSRGWNLPYNPNSICEDVQHGCYWVATYGQGVVKFIPGSAPSQDKVITYDNLWPKDTYNTNSSIYIDLLIDRNTGLLWCTMRENLACFDISDGNLRTHDTSAFLPQGKKLLDGIIQDKAGNIWVAGSSPHSFILINGSDYCHRYDLNSQYMSGADRFESKLIAHDNNGGFWTYAPRTGLNYYSSASGRLVRFSGYKVSRYISSLVTREDGGGVWVGDMHQLISCTQDNGTFHNQSVMQVSGDIHCIEDSPNDGVWVGTDNAGLYHYDKQTGKSAVVTNRILDIKSVEAIDASSAFVLSSHSGLDMVWANGRTKNLSKSLDYTSMCFDSGLLWLATVYGEVECYDISTGKFTDVPAASNLNHEKILDISVDRYGHVWTISSQCVKEYDSRNGITHTYPCGDKSMDMDYVQCIDASGHDILVGGPLAVCEFPVSNAAGKRSSSVKPCVSTVRVDSVTYYISPGQQEVEIPHDYLNLEIMLTSFEMIDSKDVHFAYRIPELSNTWNYLESGENIIRQSNLSRGSYTVEVKATGKNGLWGESVKCFTIVRLPAWYETWWAYMLYTLIIIAAAVGILWLIYERQNKRRQEQLEREITDFRFRFYTNISHELRTPLTLILTPLDSLLENFSEAKARAVLPIIRDNANKLLGMVNRILDFRRIETNNERLALTNGDIFDFLRREVDNFRPMAEKKDMYLHCDVPQRALFMNFDSNKIHHVVSNLLSNAFKFTGQGGTITLRAETTDSHLKIEVVDTGCGISDKDQEHIFDRFYQTEHKKEDASSGFGIGLHIVKEYVNLHGGEITVKSTLQKGSTFTFTIPLDIKDDETEEQQKESAPIENEKHTILIVDDNEDLRSFLQAELSDKYNVLEAGDGAEGLEVAQQNDIDIVVSDVMMPVMDGFEFCRQIKADVNTSHLFVILLTAKAGQQSELDGYNSGADAFVSKPFNMAILRNRIEHFIALRQQRFNEFMTKDKVDVQNLTTSRLDQEMLDKALSFVRQHLDDENYGVEQFSSDMCMSRMTLYRKIHSVTGQSPLDFIKTIRLKKAAELLREGSKSVTEIAEMVGFGTVRNFRKYFKDLYGVNPSEFV